MLLGARFGLHVRARRQSAEAFIAREDFDGWCADESCLRRVPLPPAPRADSGEAEAEQRQGRRFGNWRKCGGWRAGHRLSNAPS